jgi:hypothetical protein
MAFTRFHDDPCRIKKQLQQSTDVGRWILNVPGNGDRPDYIADPQIRIQTWGANLMTNCIDLESDLRGQTRRASLCPSMMYSPEHQNCNNQNAKLPCSPQEYQSKMIHQPSCQIQYYPTTPILNRMKHSIENRPFEI